MHYERATSLFPSFLYELNAAVVVAAWGNTHTYPWYALCVVSYALARRRIDKGALPAKEGEASTDCMAKGRERTKRGTQKQRDVDDDDDERTKALEEGDGMGSKL